MKKLYFTDIQKKEADRKRKKIFREKIKNGLSNSEWISEIVIQFVNRITKVAAVLASRIAFEADFKNSNGLLNTLPGDSSIDQYSE